MQVSKDFNKNSNKHIIEEIVRQVGHLPEHYLHVCFFLIYEPCFIYNGALVGAVG
jgi:hypothetical protein